jgi:hypothetical protein
MIKNKVTMHDLLVEHLNAVGAEGFSHIATIRVTRDFYAGAAAMASQFATNGILYIPNQSGSPDLDTGQSQGSAEIGGEV